MDHCQPPQIHHNESIVLPSGQKFICYLFGSCMHKLISCDCTQFLSKETIVWCLIAWNRQVFNRNDSAAADQIFVAGGFSCPYSTVVKLFSPRDVVALESTPDCLTVSVSMLKFIVDIAGFTFSQYWTWTDDFPDLPMVIGRVVEHIPSKPTLINYFYSCEAVLQFIQIAMSLESKMEDCTGRDAANWLRLPFDEMKLVVFEKLPPKERTEKNLTSSEMLLSILQQHDDHASSSAPANFQNRVKRRHEQRFVTKELVGVDGDADRQCSDSTHHRRTMRKKQRWQPFDRSALLLFSK